MSRLEAYKKFLNEWNNVHCAEFKFIVQSLCGVRELPYGMVFANRKPFISIDEYTGEEVFSIHYCCNPSDDDFFCIPTNVLDLLPNNDKDWNDSVAQSIAQLYITYMDRHLKMVMAHQMDVKAEAERKLEREERSHLLKLIKKYGVPREALK